MVDVFARAGRLAFVIGLAGVVAAVTAFSQDEPFPAWAYPGASAHGPASGSDGTRRLHLPGARRTYTEAQLSDLYVAPDWFPETHPAAPRIVLTGRPGKVMACGYCHMPDGSGRPENAGLSGLPADYIRRQAAAFRSGERQSASHGWVPTALMSQVAAGARDPELAAAAAYFASIPFRKHYRVVETDRISGSEAQAFQLRAVPGGGEPLGARIVEGPSDFERFERRDPRLIYTAYVPIGSLIRGEHLARTGGDGVTLACASCHGEGLKGGDGAVGPPLAGRSPSYLFRQLYGFRSGARQGDAAQPMRQVTAGLSQRDMIALAAYVGSLEP